MASWMHTLWMASAVRRRAGTQGVWQLRGLRVLMACCLVWLACGPVQAESPVAAAENDPANGAELVVVVHPDNPVTALTPPQIKQLFLGRLRLFPDTRIAVQIVDLPHDDPVFSAFYERYTGMDAARLSRHRSRYFFTGQGRLPDSVDDADAVLNWVANTPGGIGYLRRDQWRDSVRIVYP